MKTISKGYVCIILSAVIFGCMPLMAKHIYADGANAITLVLLRNAISLPMLFCLSLARRESFSASPKRIASVVVIGIFGCAITPVLLFSSYNYMDGGTATVLHFVYPALVLVLELLFLRSRVRGANIIAILLCIAGIAFFYPPGGALNVTGSALALSSGFTYAIYIFLLGKFGRGTMGGYTFSFFATLGSTVALLAACLLSDGFSMPQSFGGWLLCVAFALAINVGAVVLFQNGAFLIGGQKASILSTVEPITSLIIGFAFLNEHVGLLSVIGSVLIISASVLISVFDKEK